MNIEKNKEIHSAKLSAGRRTYFLDIKRTQRGNDFLVISEKRRSTEEEEGPFQKSRIFVYPEYARQLLDALQEKVEQLEEMEPAEES